MYTLGKLRHQIKSFSPLSEFRRVKTFSLTCERRQDKILLVLNEFRYGVKGGRSLKDG